MPSEDHRADQQATLDVILALNEWIENQIKAGHDPHVLAFAMLKVAVETGIEHASKEVWVDTLRVTADHIEEGVEPVAGHA
jgi:hypothetical protein